MSIARPEPELLRTARSGSGVDDCVELFERVYASHDINVGVPGPDGFSYRYRAVGDDQVTAASSTVDARRWGTINAGREYVLAWATVPGMTLDTGGRDPIAMLPGVPVMYPTQRAFTFDALPATQHVLRFDADFLEGVAASARDDLPKPLRFRRTLDTEAVRTLQDAIRSAAPTILGAASGPHRRAVNARIAEAVIAAFDVTPTGRVVDSGSRTVRDAQEWIAAHAREPITSTDVHRALGMSARGLQAAFSRHADTTPMRFLREFRLDRVRADLVAADPGTTTVAAVAGAWGFAHLGRFAGYYAAEFGESPSATLHRRARAAA
ncbi:helix-turn-helix domain-containing protein [Curtobacterium sp. 'Ferrero']|uniref:helix-turn-helix domain-containing protein n=1 Tax=Curtobacterium sp. 'Ferrero' TaxID=2033654 RepID=UPI001142108E|nr:helix-turn-helix domain-containing protein [Curtobacterium sp. 'Ferrero']